MTTHPNKLTQSMTHALPAASAAKLAPWDAPAFSPAEVRDLLLEMQIKLHLHGYGWLTAWQIGECIAADYRDPLQAARRTLRSLDESGEALVRGLPNGSRAYVLTASGAKSIRHLVSSPRSGKDILDGGRSLSSWKHRWISNQWCILNASQGHRVWPEYAIQSYRSPLPHTDIELGPKEYRRVMRRPARGWRGKQADGLVIYRGLDTHRPTPLRWTEVEHSRRRPSDMQKLAQFIVSATVDPVINHGHLEITAIDLVFANTLTLLTPILVAVGRELDALEKGAHPSDVDKIRRTLGRLVTVSVLPVSQAPRIDGDIETLRVPLAALRRAPLEI